MRQFHKIFCFNLFLFKEKAKGMWPYSHVGRYFIIIIMFMLWQDDNSNFKTVLRVSAATNTLCSALLFTIHFIYAHWAFTSLADDLFRQHYIVATLAFMALKTDPGEYPSAAVAASEFTPKWTGVGGLLVTPKAFFLSLMGTFNRPPTFCQFLRNFINWLILL